ncbi:hypothetical protein RAM80_16515 [Pseudomonas sp. App30]|uniref:hypothetical protein n=1 Tax=Pseudomonas sp. App30 TaxID=3068990 RepID=UPI003A7FC0D1
MNTPVLGAEVKRMLGRMEDEQFVARIVSDFESLPFDEEFWSKGPSYVLLPFGLELTGYPPAKRLAKRPKGDRNLHHYKVSNGDVVGVVSLNESGDVVDQEVFFQQAERRISVRFDNDNLPVSSTELHMVEGAVKSAMRVDIDGDYWAYNYFYEGGKVVKLQANASNSPPDVEIYVEYKGENTSGLYFLKDSRKVYLYEG